MSLSTSSCDLVHSWRSGNHIEEAIKNEKRKFISLNKTDILDFDELTSFDWDTMYLFEGGANRDYVSRELYQINWFKGFNYKRYVDESDYRFIFVKDNEAVNYIDVPRSLFSGIHFSKFYIDEEGNFNNYYYDKRSERELHEFTLNKWSRKDSKFVIVAFLFDHPSKFYYTDLILKDRKLLNKEYNPHDFYLHPLKGCRYLYCLANSQPISKKKLLRPIE